MINQMYVNLLFVRYAMLEREFLKAECIILTLPWWNKKESLSRGRILWHRWTR